MMNEKDRKILKRYEKDIKGFAITCLVLAGLSAFILLVDKYLAGTWFWWIVVTLSCGGYLYMRVQRDLHWNPLAMGKGQVAVKAKVVGKATQNQTTRDNGLVTTFTDPESARSFLLSDVIKIVIETTGDGPFDEDLYWIFYLQSEPPVRMAGPVAMAQGIFEALNGLDGVDFEASIQASSTVEPALFSIWEKAKND